MVLVQFAVDGEGQYLGTTKNTPASMHHTMKDLWKLLVHDGVITQVRTKVLLSLLSLPPSPLPPPHPHTLNTSTWQVWYYRDPWSSRAAQYLLAAESGPFCVTISLCTIGYFQVLGFQGCDSASIFKWYKNNCGSILSCHEKLSDFISKKALLTAVFVMPFWLSLPTWFCFQILKDFSVIISATVRSIIPSTETNGIYYVWRKNIIDFLINVTYWWPKCKRYFRSCSEF